MNISIIIPMEPVAKGRARVCVRNGRAFAYTPAKTAQAEKDIQAFLTGYPMFAAGVPLAMTVTFYMTRPKSAKKRLYPTVKPDCSNLIKTVEDAANGRLYHDDAQIIRLLIRKEYGDVPRIEITIEEIE
jgi:Holliday junction resolvase RusA-like endonuclease